MFIGQNLSTKTYYKTKKDAAQRVMELKKSLLPTSETYSGAILSDAKIPQMFERVNTLLSDMKIDPQTKTDNSGIKQSINRIERAVAKAKALKLP